MNIKSILLSSTIFVFLLFHACKTSDVTASSPSVTALNCSSATVSANATNGSSYTGTITVPYTGGNGVAYSSSTVTSTGVSGLTATIAAGTLASGAGSVVLSVTGTPTSAGTASFAISLGGQSCSASLTVQVAKATISSLTCTATPTTATNGTAYTGTVSMAYTGGNGGSFDASTASSTGVTGLTATVAAGTLASGAGTLTYNITGTPTAVGTASFALSLGGQSCTVTVTVSAGTSSTSSCDSKTGIDKIVCLAEAFKATLSSSQVSTLQLDYTYSNMKTWSNLPAALSPRIGIKLGSLSSTQLAAAKALINAMTASNVANEGYEEVQQVWAADDWLVSDGKANSDYGSGNYYLAFYGTPSATGTFEIMETGHHKTVANTYKNGTLVAATPHFEAVEPISWTPTSGTTIAPISQETAAMKALLASLSTSQLATAKSSSTFSDLVLAPGKDWQFPTTYSGLVCSGLTAAQKALALAVIKTYTDDIDATNGAAFLATYTAEIDKTYITYSGSGNMDTKYDYFRIDGPHVWIELHMPAGIIYQNGIHIHSIWRDRVSDYAGTTK